MIDHTNWYRHFFNGMALDLWDKAVTPEYTQKEIEFINKIVTIPKGAHILDMPCGFGRHSLELASQGFKLTSVDISTGYIDRLKFEAQSRGLPVEAILMNMLDFEPVGTFDLSLCLGNSFNYFTHAKMKQFVAVLAGSLTKGGSLIINTGSLAECVFTNPQKQNWMEVGDILFLMAHDYDCQIGVLKTEMQFMRNGVEEKKTAYHFIYTLAEIVRLLTGEGMQIKATYGDLEGNTFLLGSQQVYILAEKV
ncbi:MAG: class I SAM-dependent methyltransferase [Saprospiraceae bacterium]|nr:class I SAM-dependent methyltransferase [Saprospiraceae bacterium]